MGKNTFSGIFDIVPKCLAKCRAINMDYDFSSIDEIISHTVGMCGRDGYAS